MSALIVQFPGKLADKRNRLKGSRLALIEVDQMRRFRIFGEGTMKDMTAAQCELLRLIHLYSASGQSPKLSELEALARQYARALCHIRCADEFISELEQNLS